MRSPGSLSFVYRRTVSGSNPRIAATSGIFSSSPSLALDNNRRAWGSVRGDHSVDGEGRQTGRMILGGQPFPNRETSPSTSPNATAAEGDSKYVSRHSAPQRPGPPVTASLNVKSDQPLQRTSPVSTAVDIRGHATSFTDMNPRCASALELQHVLQSLVRTANHSGVMPAKRTVWFVAATVSQTASLKTRNRETTDPEG